MHAGSDVEMDFDDPETWNDFGFNKKDDVWDVKLLSDKVWDQALLVPPSMIPDDEEPVDPNDIHCKQLFSSYCYLLYQIFTFLIM